MLMDHKFFTYIYLLIILFSIGTLIYYFNQNQGLWWDEAVYLGLAENIASGQGYYINEFQESFRPPVYPYFIAGLFYLGLAQGFVQYFSILFAILSVFVIYILGMRLYNNHVALLSALVLSASHFFLFFSLKILTESLFILLSLLMILTYYIGFTGNKRYYLYAGLLTSLAFLTRYMGGLLFIFYLLYPLVVSKSKDDIKKNYLQKYFWLGLVISILALIPWLMLNNTYLDSPVASLFTGFDAVSHDFYIGPWYFHFENWIEFFGYVGLFAIPGLYYLVRHNRRQDKLVLMIFILSIIALILIPRKEVRYLLHYFHIYAILIAVGIHHIRKKNILKYLVPLAVIIFLIMNLSVGLNMINSDLQGGVSIKEASIFVGENIEPGETVISESIPVVYLKSKAHVIRFPPDESDLSQVIQDNNVKYIVIDEREPTHPDYVFDNNQPSSVFDQFKLTEFQEYGETRTWVYGINA